MKIQIATRLMKISHTYNSENKSQYNCYNEPVIPGVNHNTKNPAPPQQQQDAMSNNIEVNQEE